MAVFRKVDRYIFAWLNLDWIQNNETVSELPEDVEFGTHASDEHCQLCKSSTLNLNEMHLWKEICRMHQSGRNFISFISLSLLSNTIALLGHFKKFILRKLVRTSTQMNFAIPAYRWTKEKNALEQNSTWCVVKRRNWTVWSYCIFFAIWNSKNRGAQFYSGNDLFKFRPKTSLNVIWKGVASFTFEGHLFHIP